MWLLLHGASSWCITSLESIFLILLKKDKKLIAANTKFLTSVRSFYRKMKVEMKPVFTFGSSTSAYGVCNFSLITQCIIQERLGMGKQNAMPCKCIRFSGVGCW